MKDFIKIVDSKKIHFWLAILLAFLIPFSFILTRYVIGLFVFTWLLSVRENFKNLKLQWNPVFMLLLVLFLCYLVSLFYSDNLTIAFRDIQKKISLVLLPLVFLNTDFQSGEKKSILLGFIFGVLTASLISLVYFVFSYYTSSDFARVFSNYPLYQFYSKFFIFGHSSYYAMYLVMAVIISFGLLKNQLMIGKEKKISIFLVFGILFFSVFVFLNSSRAGMVTLVLTLFYMVFISARGIVYKLALVGGLVVISTLMFTNYRFDDYFKLAQQYADNEVVDKEVVVKNSSMRIVFWDTSLDLIRENPWLGVGTGDVKEELANRYEEKGYTNLERKFNPHNQFLSTMLATGIPGLLSLLGIYFFSMVRALKKRNHLLFTFFLLTFVHFQFESMLEKLSGVIFFAFFLGILWNGLAVKDS